MPSKFHTAAAEEAAARILDQFENPESLPEKLSQMVLAAGGRHCDKYSWGNQLIVAIMGYSDAAGYKQWRNVYGRQVDKGQRGFPILAPIKRSFTATERDPETGAETQRRVTYITGWKDVKVFGEEQTTVCDEAKWERHQGKAAESQRIIEASPLYEAAVRMGAKVAASGHLAAHGILGCYSPTTSEIKLAVENMSTFAHELVHFIDDRLGNLTRRWGQQPDNEIVAELGGAIILTAMGLEHEADLGGCWEYVSRYTTKDEPDPLAAAAKLLNRTLEAVSLILQAIADPAAEFPWTEEEAA